MAAVLLLGGPVFAAEDDDEFTREDPPESHDTERRDIAPGVQTIGREGARQTPGAWGDPFRATINVPAAARSFLGAGGEIVLRGSAPEDTRLHVDGHEIPLLYHFGGLKSLIHPELVERIDIIPGGFGVYYGRATGGVLDTRLRSSRPGFARWNIQTDLIDTGVLARFPVGGNGVLAVGARRSYADLALAPLALGVPLPHYFDYQVKGDFAVGAHDALSLFVFGADDGVGGDLTELEGNIDPRLLRTVFHRVQGRWRHVFGRGHHLTVSAVAGLDQGLAAGSASPDPTQLLGFRSDYRHPLAPYLFLNAGLEHETRLQKSGPTLLLGNESTTGIPDPILLSTDPPPSVSDTGAYAEVEWTPAPGTLLVIPGVRVDRFGAADTFVAAPRVQLGWRVAPSTTLHAATGLYHQPPRIGVLGAFVTDVASVGVELSPERASHSVVGVAHGIGDWMIVEGYGFFTHSQHVVEVYPQDVVDQEALVPVDGSGRAYGAELMIRLVPKEKWFGWFGYSLTRAERRDRGTTRWYPSGYDQTHSLNAVLSYRVLKTVRVGTRIRFATGTPYTPYIGSVYDADSRRYYGIHGPRNSVRGEAFFQADVRIDKTFRADKWDFVLFADVLNVTNHQNRELPDYNFDFTRFRYYPGMPVLPMIGLEAIR